MRWKNHRLASEYGGSKEAPNAALAQGACVGESWSCPHFPGVVAAADVARALNCEPLESAAAISLLSLAATMQLSVGPPLAGAPFFDTAGRRAPALHHVVSAIRVVRSGSTALDSGRVREWLRLDHASRERLACSGSDRSDTQPTEWYFPA
jgi:hypothetical protein